MLCIHTVPDVYSVQADATAYFGSVLTNATFGTQVFQFRIVVDLSDFNNDLDFIVLIMVVHVKEELAELVGELPGVYARVLSDLPSLISPITYYKAFIRHTTKKCVIIFIIVNLTVCMMIW